MQLKIGDKVRFLDEKGEGIVSGIVNSKTVNVRIKEGFDIPYPIIQLISIEPSKPVEPKKEAIAEETIKEFIPETIALFPTKSTFSKGVYLLFIPEGNESSLESPLQMALFNYTDHDLLYTLSIKRDKGYATISTGDIAAGKNNFILLISRSELERFINLKIDLIYYSNAVHEAIDPISELIRINPVRFYKENNYVKTPFTSKRAFIVNVAKQGDDSNWDSVEFDPKQLAHAMKQKHSSTPTKLSKPHQLNDPELEVDLHIEELIDNHSGMNNAQILDCQLKHVKRELESAIDDNVKKITFIHGVGIGRLKHEIHLLLKSYPKIRFYDAPYSKYGFGATEVALR